MVGNQKMNKSRIKSLAIIPCCGFGKRMNLSPNQSKEMLPGPNGDPLIDYSLNLCAYNKLEPLILVRKEKKDLIKHLEKRNINYIIMKPGKEWAETVYNSNDHWREDNFLILPDTRFESSDIINQMKKSLEFGCNVVFALHEVPDIKNWGEVKIYGYSEKPKETGNGQAWGIIGFKKESGLNLFKSMQEKKLWNFHEPYTNFLFLDKFKDLTRTGKVE